MTMKENKKNVGSIWLSRKILNWQHFGEPNYLKVFLTLLLVANHKQRWWKGIKIERGETVITQEGRVGILDFFSKKYLKNVACAN